MAAFSYVLEMARTTPAARAVAEQGNLPPKPGRANALGADFPGFTKTRVYELFMVRATLLVRSCAVLKIGGTAGQGLTFCNYVDYILILIVVTMVITMTNLIRNPNQWRKACSFETSDIKGRGSMILSFSDKVTEALFALGKYRRVPDRDAIRAKQKLDFLDAAVRLEDLYFPPSNRFERLAGGNPRRYSIRVTRQYRITFEWNGKDAENVRFEDYH